MAIREGAWDCPFCGKERNRGPEKFCGGCGSPRGPEVKFYLPEDARVVEDAAELERARAGPDWTCPFCGGDNKGWNGFCTGCGSAKDATAARQVVQHAGEAPTTAVAAMAASAPPAPSPPPGPAPATGGGAGKWLLGCFGGCGMLVLFLIVLAMFMGMTHDERLTVTGARWERVIAVESYDTVREAAWKDEVPAGARHVSESREVRSHRKVQTGTETRTRTVTKEVPDGTEQVKVGTKDMGNGYFEDVYETRTKYRTESSEETYEEPVYREEPVYDVKVTYEIDKWHESRKAQANGNDTSPRWPDPGLASNEREGARNETFALELRDEKGNVRKYVPKTADEFSRFQIGSAYTAKVDRMGNVDEIR